MDATEATYYDAGLFAMGAYSKAVANSLYWISPKISGVTVGALYSFNGTTLSDDKKFSEENPVWSLAAKYEGDKFKGLVGAEGTHYGNKGDYGNRKDTLALRIGGQYNFGAFKLYGNYAYNLNATTFSIPGQEYTGSFGALANMGNGKGVNYHSFGLGTRVPVAGGDFVAQVQYLTGKSKNEALTNGFLPQVTGLTGLQGHKKIRKYTVAAGYTYPFSKRTHVYWMNSYSKGSGGLNEDVDPTSNRFLSAAGITHSF
jgi:predicted porin